MMMKIDVYDSYAKDAQGQLMHFDVLVEAGTSPEKALKYGREWLESVGKNAADLEQNRCNFCHSEAANPKVKEVVEKEGYYILKMEGCPD
jgi:hypothetical protein